MKPEDCWCGHHKERDYKPRNQPPWWMVTLIILAYVALMFGGAWFVDWMHAR